MDGEMELGNICRICSNKSEGISIFSSKGKEISLEEKIKKFLYITVSEEDDLPKTVCSYCTNKLDSIHKFAQMAAQIQIKLSEMISIPVKTSDPETDPMEMENEYLESLDDLEQPIKLEHSIKHEHPLKQEEDTVRGSLLHSILTKDKDKGEPAVTELEVTVDPMLFLADQDEDDEEEEVEKIFPESSHSSRSDTNSEEDGNVFGGVLEAKPYQCSVCPRGFNSDLSLKNHLWGHGSMRKILASSDLNLNRFQVDSKPRVFNSQCLCTVCGRVYPTRSTLRAHQITHSNLRPHKCSLCEKTFKRNQDLKFHINQHTGERPYRCPYCPKAFASSGNCFSHRKRMHPKQLARDKKAAARQFYL